MLVTDEGGYGYCQVAPILKGQLVRLTSSDDVPGLTTLDATADISNTIIAVALDTALQVGQPVRYGCTPGKIYMVAATNAAFTSGGLVVINNAAGGQVAPAATTRQSVYIGRTLFVGTPAAGQLIPIVWTFSQGTAGWANYSTQTNGAVLENKDGTGIGANAAGTSLFLRVSNANVMTLIANNLTPTVNLGVALGAVAGNYWDGITSRKYYDRQTGATACAVNAAGAGAGGTATYTGTDMKGMIEVVTAGVPGANSIIATLTFNAGWASKPYIVLTPANQNATEQALNQRARADDADVTTGGWVLRSGTAGLTAGTTYRWVIQTFG